ncbi:RNA signal recognition particle [Candidatus Adlerbacteria bacterium RIFCSPLOWO2_01_FULL_51_16]|uniref:RNA signal recognition particle n=1 Tax=Candidatus Adlerbacteria bacterium RIFCSPLOWO2_01_FULL_51_16 TaxID=1797243 RepID=A0A1F4XGN4_9BACT|nr:MAG: RNA signal recognition particle [Candidatus Adlerbacteria bacterium RIFCSPLOWO2_01_FULL_51_16]
MAKYVDGFVLVVPKSKIAAYRTMAAAGARMWKKHGALDYKECIGDDLNPHMGGMPALTFPKLVKLKKGETVAFSYIVYKSRAHRDQVNKKVMAQMDKEYKGKKMPPMPFDMKRMAYGGFKVIVSAGK